MKAYINNHDLSNYDFGLSDFAQKVLAVIEEGSEDKPVAVQEIKDKLGCSSAEVWEAMMEMMTRGLWIQATSDRDAVWENTNEISYNAMSDYLYGIMVDLAKAIMGMDHSFEYQAYAEDLVANIFEYSAE